MGASTPAQVEELVKLGFHKAAGCSAEDLDSYAGRPENKSGILVVSELFVPIAKQCELLGITNKLKLDQLETHENTVPLPARRLYWCYGIDDGRAMKGLPPEEAILRLSDKKRFPAHTALVLAIFRMDLCLVSLTHRIDIGGSRVEKSYVPALLLANGHPSSDTPHLSSSPLSAKGSVAYGMASFERVANGVA